MSRILIIFSIFLICSTDLIAQNRKFEFEEIEILQKKTPKPLVVLIMTSWCKYCHAMSNTMLKNVKVAALLNEKFYAVFLNAEEKKDIYFAGRIFKHKAGLHELARELGTIKKQISYPTLSILNSKNEILYQNQGYLSPSKMLYILEKIEQK